MCMCAFFPPVFQEKKNVCVSFLPSKCYSCVKKKRKKKEDTPAPHTLHNTHVDGLTQKKCVGKKPYVLLNEVIKNDKYNLEDATEKKRKNSINVMLIIGYGNSSHFFIIKKVNKLLRGIIAFE